MEAVDLAGEQGLDRLREPGHRTRPADRPHQCLEEHGVPATATGQVGHRVGRDRVVLERVLDELERSVRRERRRAQRGDVGALCGNEARLVAPVGSP